MRKIFIIFCRGLLLLTCGCGQKDEVTPTINTVKTASDIKKTEKEKTPTVICTPKKLDTLGGAYHFELEAFF